MELKDLHILFTTQDMGMARVVVALDKETGQPLEAVLTPWVVGGGQGEKINACKPISYEDVRRLAEKAGETKSFNSLNEDTWRSYLP